MRKSIVTLILFVSIQIFAFAQSAQSTMTVNENLDKVVKIVDGKTDITGTFAHTGQWEILVDDAKVKTTKNVVKEIKKDNLEDLMQAGLKYVQKDKTMYACYRYRVVSAEENVHTMYLFECGF
jgi:hypothetical protein